MKIELVVDDMFTALGIELTAWDQVVAQASFGFILWANPPDEKLKSELAAVALFNKPVIFVVKKGEDLPPEVVAACNIIKTIYYDKDDKETFEKEVREAMKEALGPDPKDFLMIAQEEL